MLSNKNPFQANKFNLEFPGAERVLAYKNVHPSWAPSNPIDFS